MLLSWWQVGHTMNSRFCIRIATWPAHQVYHEHRKESNNQIGSNENTNPRKHRIKNGLIVK